MRKFSAVYRIRCVVVGKCYIGGTSNLRGRWIQHKADLRSGSHRNLHLQRAWNKYGESAFVFEILERANRNNVFEKEQKWIDKEKPKFNGTPNAIKPPLYGRKMSKKSRTRISETLKGNVNRRGKKAAEETKEKMRRSQKKRYEKESRSRETRDKLAEAARGKKHSESTKEKMRMARLEYNKTHDNPMKGKKRPDLARLNRSRAKKEKVDES